jgi:magnesium transporter
MAATGKKKKNRHRKRRNRRQSFLAPDDSDHPGPMITDRTPELQRPTQDQCQDHPPFYRGRNLSNTSLESEALLDHR